MKNQLVENNSNTKLLVSLVNSAITQTEGVILDDYKPLQKILNNAGIYVYAEDINNVVIDVHVNIVYGYDISKVACDLQERIINMVTESTKMKIKKINVIVDNVVFNK